MKKQLIKVSIKDLEDMKKLGGKRELSPYIHKNPLVRWLFWKRLKVMLKLAKDSERVLDFGAGFGVFMPSLSKNFKEVHSLDLNTKPLEYVKKKYNLSNVEIKKGKESELPYENDFFDIIFAADVLEHFKNLEQIQKEFKRVLKKEGCIIVSGPTENFLYKLARLILFWHLKKPRDHYVTVKEVFDVSEKIFKIEKIKVIPLSFIPAFKIYKGVKK